VSMHGSIIKVVVTCLAFFHFAVVVVGFVESLVEVDECDRRATLNVSISFPAPHPAFRLGIGIMFTLLANTVDGSAGMGDAHQFSQPFSIFYTFHYPGSRPTSATTHHDPRLGVEDYQQIVNMELNFEETQCSQIFDVMIFGDGFPEDAEELNFTLILDPTLMGIASEWVIVDPAVASVRIRDSDRKFGCFPQLMGPWFVKEEVFLCNIIRILCTVECIVCILGHA